MVCPPNGVYQSWHLSVLNVKQLSAMSSHVFFLWAVIGFMLVLFVSSLSCCSINVALSFGGGGGLVEGLENQADAAAAAVPDPGQQAYEPYNVDSPGNALILAQQNAGNISYLKQRVDEVAGVARRIDTMQQNMDLMQSQLDALVQQQAEFAQDLAGGTEPPTVTGTGADLDDEEEA